MNNKGRFPNAMFGASLRPENAVVAIMLLLLFLMFLFLFLTLTAQSAQAQTYTIIHSFTGGGDGSHPEATMVMDRAGNLYGTTRDGGRRGHGTVFSLAYKNSGWVVTPVYAFGEGGGDEEWPGGALMFGADGSLFGMAKYAEGGGCCGRVFHLTPPPTAPRSTLNLWNETTIHQFTGAPDGDTPAGPLNSDAAGAIYLTTQGGGQFNAGAVIKLTPTEGGWIETILYSFPGLSDGAGPMGGVIFDNAGNLYGTTGWGGNPNGGTVFKLTPSPTGWTESVLYDFQGEGGGGGYTPLAGLVRDDSGNLYGSTDPCYQPPSSPNFTCSSVFMLSPSGGTWTLTTLYGSDDRGDQSSLVRDAAGNLYGTTLGGAYDYGSVFKLSPTNGGWTYTSLHDFTGGHDGVWPFGGLTLDANNNLYGTTWEGGASAFYGIVFEITP